MIFLAKIESMEPRKIIYNPLGTTFKEGDVLLQVVETKDYRTCLGCYYAMHKNGKRIYKKSCIYHNHACTAGVRKDGKQVVFTPIN